MFLAGIAGGILGRWGKKGSGGGGSGGPVGVGIGQSGWDGVRE